jgi:hypothetical protein
LIRVAVVNARLEADDRVSSEITRLTALWQQLGTAKFPLIKWFNRTFRIPHLNRRLAWLAGEPDRVSLRLQQELDALTAELDRIRRRPDAEIARIVQPWEQRLNQLEALATSAEYAGALAELQMTNLLVHGLPATYAVFNDVSIKMDKWVYSHGEHRRAAQIDHAVVGPGGVFVIEDKRWSAQFASSGKYYDPYSQVRWAGKLCHFLLSDKLGMKVRVREIIATSGQLPPKPRDSFAKVLPPQEVAAFVKWFKTELDTSSIQRITQILSRRC